MERGCTAAWGEGGEKKVASTKQSDGSCSSGGGGAVAQPATGMAGSGPAQQGPLSDGEVQRIRSVGFDEDDSARQVHHARAWTKESSVPGDQCETGTPSGRDAIIRSSCLLYCRCCCGSETKCVGQNATQSDGSRWPRFCAPPQAHACGVPSVR